MSERVDISQVLISVVSHLTTLVVYARVIVQNTSLTADDLVDLSPTVSRRLLCIYVPIGLIAWFFT